MDCNTSGFPVPHHLRELAQTHVYWVGDAIKPSCPLLSVPFSSCLQSFPASWSFPVTQLFASDGQSIGVSTSASVLPMNIQGWFPLGFTGLLSLLSKVFFNTTVPKHLFFSAQSSLWPDSHIYWRRKWQPTPVFLPGESHGQRNLVTMGSQESDMTEWLWLDYSHLYMTTGKTIALTRWTFVGQVMCLLFNTLASYVIAFLPRSKRLLISWLRSPSAVILEPPKWSLSLFPLFPHLFAMKWWDQMAWS